MKTPEYTLRRTRALPILALILSAGTLVTPSLRAQSADQSADTPVTQPKVVTLDPFLVRDEGSDYHVTSATSATRLATPIADLPQTITVVDSALMADTSAYEFIDAFQFTPGVTARQNTTDGVLIHGFIDSARYRDGFSAPAYFSDAANIERIEVVSGPAAAIAGQSNTGGYVNVITKQPTSQQTANLDIVVGSYDFLRGVIDFGGRLWQSGNQAIDYRLIAEHTQGDGFRTNDHISTTGIYPSLRWSIGDNTSLTIEGEFLDSTEPSDYGQPYYPGVDMTVPTGVTPTFNYNKAFWLPASFNLNEPGWNRHDTPVTGYATFFHNFGRFLSFRQSFNYARLAYDQVRVIEGTVPAYATSSVTQAGNTFFIGTDGSLWMARKYDHIVNWTKDVAAQGDLDFNYDVGHWVENRTLFGYIFQYSSGRTSEAGALINPLSAFSPVYGATGLTGPVDPQTDTTTVGGNQFSYFVNHQSQFFDHRIIATVGFREDQGFGNVQTNDLNGIQTVNRAGPGVLSPMYGLSLRPMKWLTFYGLYSVASAPETFTDEYPRISTTDPRQVILSGTPITSNKEFGAKADLLDNKLSVTLSHYDILQQDVIVSFTDSNLPGGSENQLQSGNRAHGWELAAYGDILPNVELWGGYDYTTTGAAGGLELRGVPDNKVTALLKYRWADWKGRPWTFRAGVQWETSMWGTQQNYYRVPGATSLDLGVTFVYKKWRFDLSAKNVTDTPFPANMVNPDSNTVNAPRQFFLTASTKF